MPSTFTSNTGIELIADGEQTGAWGQTTNGNFDIVDRALNGSVNVTLSGTTHTLTTSDGVLSDGQAAVLVFTGSPSGTNTVTIAPNTAQKTYLVRNTTAQSVVLRQGSGGNVTVPAGRSAVVFSNGGGASAAVVNLSAGLVPVLTNAGVTATTAELNLVDGSVAGTIVNSKAVVYGAAGQVNATTLQIAGTSITTTAAELNVLGGVTATTAELNILAGVTATTAELNILAGVTATTAELNVLGGVTATTAELNILDGVTATTAELNILDGVTATTAELNVLDGVTATTAELNILDGVTATTAELNILDGVTATTAELNVLDGIAGIASKSEAQAGTATNKLMTPFRVRDAFNATGTAPIFACRAFVNFNGAGTVAIRASGNVSSITDNGIGNYRVNFTTAMQDANYCLVVSGATTSSNNTDRHAIPNNSGYSTTSCVVRSGSSGSNSPSDFDFMHVAIFR